MISTNKRNIFFLSLLFFIFGIFIRLYNLNFESYWWDEILAFWIDDPNVSYEETYNRRNLTDQSSFLYHLILKNFYHLAGYNPELGRLVPFFFGIISIPLLAILSYQIKSDKSFALTILLVSVNVYLILYSQENRHYTFIFFLSIINLIYFYKMFFLKKFNYKQGHIYILFIFFSVLGLSEHPFILIILFSQVLYSIYYMLIFKKKNYLFFLSVVLILAIYLLLNYKFLTQNLISKEYHFVSQLEWNFLYDFFFSRFFGSLIMGLIYLCTLLFLIFNFRKKIFLTPNKYLLLVFIIIFSYLIPFVYGLYFVPILFDRYIIFILIPILILLAILLFEINNIKLRNIILIFVIAATFFNGYLEIRNKENTKPEFKNILNFIKDDDTKKIAFIVNEGIDDTSLYVVENYVTSLPIFKENNLEIFKINNFPDSLNRIWLICYEPFTSYNCEMPSHDKWIVKANIKKHLINARLIEIIN